LSDLPETLMKTLMLLAVGLTCLGTAGVLRAAPVVSHFPQHGLGPFLASHFDLASIRSSFGPRRNRPGQRTLADFGMTPTTATDNDLIYDVPGDWYVRMQVTGRRDVNGDGVEDLEVCLTDRAQNGGTYSSVQGLVITRYTGETYALALSFSASYEVCKHAAGN
jgi:hypothetical protein